jgi:hypothetical protein
VRSETIVTLPGQTLADAGGGRRLRKLRESRDNLRAIIAEKQESIAIIEHEMYQLDPSSVSMEAKAEEFAMRQIERIRKEAF